MKIELTAPKNYSELTEKQVRYIASLMVVGQTEDQIRTKCFIRFSGIVPVMSAGDNYYFIRRKIKGFFALKHEEVAYFSRKFDWILKKYKGIKPVQKYGRYLAPDELIRDTVFAQYLDAENYYQAYIFTKQRKYLVKIMAILYHKKGHVYNDKNAAAAEKYFSRNASEVDTMIVLMWMIGLKEAIAKKFDALFVRAQKQDNENEVVPPDMFAIVTNQVRMLTEGDITKNKQVLSANTWDALTELNEKCKDNKSK